MQFITTASSWPPEPDATAAPAAGRASTWRIAALADGSPDQPEVGSTANATAIRTAARCADRRSRATPDGDTIATNAPRTSESQDRRSRHHSATVASTVTTPAEHRLTDQHRKSPQHREPRPASGAGLVRALVGSDPTDTHQPPLQPHHSLASRPFAAVAPRPSRATASSARC